MEGAVAILADSARGRDILPDHRSILPGLANGLQNQRTLRIGYVPGYSSEI